MVSEKKNPLFVYGWDRENPSLVITVCHHSASPVMPIGDPRDGFFYPTLTLMIDSSSPTDHRLVSQMTDFSIPPSHKK